MKKRFLKIVISRAENVSLVCLKPLEQRKNS